ncbi:MAG TPA: A/G-specific adenine glycosylase [Lentimicrobium sp.]|nr:A/G-specific adenine glycosylase [Lentimicrobium sp.]
MDFCHTILTWYQNNKRELPWRESSDPYKIWISEVILQQTRVEQGLPYYFRFLEAFPDIKALAGASEQDVLYTWKGLGYYSRARNMHHTAQIVMSAHKGNFPGNYTELIKLKGIGDYTAAAISSICQNEVHPAVDGNVIRVISRFFGVTEKSGSLQRKIILDISRENISKDNPGEYNQAVMEFGAKLCTPAAPGCSICDLRLSCYAFKNKMTTLLPSKKEKIKRKTRYFNYFHFITPDGKVVIQKRTKKDIWLNLWEFPLVEANILFKPEEAIALLVENPDIVISPESQTVQAGSQASQTHNYQVSNVYDFIDYYDYKHQLTHQILEIRFLSFRVKTILSELNNNKVLANPHEHIYPLPRVIEKFLERNDYFFWH